MGKASSAKKVARAARAGGNRRPGQRRPIGFPLAVGIICVLGLSLIVFARNQRAADAFPRANEDHVHSAYDIFTCTTGTGGEGTTTTTAPGETTTTAPGETTTTAAGDPAATPEGETTTTAPGETTTTAAGDPAATPEGETTTTVEGETTTTAPGETTTTTAPGETPTTTASTTTLAPGDVPGQWQQWVQDASQDVLGIHTHGDGLMHIHPFSNSAAGVNATLGKFLDQTGIVMTNDTLRLPDGTEFIEGTTKCQDGKDGELQVAKWNSADEAGKGNKPNQVFTEGFDKIRLGQDQVFVIAFMPTGSTLKSKDDVVNRIKTVTDVAPTDTGETAPEPSVSVSLPPDSTGSDPNATPPASTDTTVVPDSTSSP